MPTRVLQDQRRAFMDRLRAVNPEFDLDMSNAKYYAKANNDTQWLVCMLRLIKTGETLGKQEAEGRPTIRERITRKTRGAAYAERP